MSSRRGGEPAGRRALAAGGRQRGAAHRAAHRTGARTRPLAWTHPAGPALPPSPARSAYAPSFNLELADYPTWQSRVRLDGTPTKMSSMERDKNAPTMESLDNGFNPSFEESKKN